MIKRMIRLIPFVVVPIVFALPLLCSAAPPAAPTVSTSNLGANQVTLGVTGTGTGTLTGYFTLLPGSGTSCGTAAQIKAGLNSSGTAAPHFGSLPLATGVTGSYTIRNLTQSSAYSACVIADNGASSTPASVNLTTTAASALTNPAWNTVGSAGFSTGGVYNTSLAFAPDGTPYVAYQDASNKAIVMKYNNASWGAVGTTGFSTGGLGDSSPLAFAPDGTAYLAYSDVGNSNKATVMRYNGTAWGVVGTAGFSTGVAHTPSLAFAPDDTPYLAYQDATNNATVMRYNGTAWGVVGTASFSKGWAGYLSLALAPDGTPYVAYQGASNKATVMRYNGTAWVAVGTAGFSTGGVYNTSLAFAPDGTPYVAYKDSTSGKATVMQYNGTSWVVVGTAGFSTGGVYSPSLAFAPDGTPYLAYQDVNTGNNGATVMKYTGANWVAVGSAGFSAGGASYPSLAFAPDGTPYLAYRDSTSGKATVMKLTSVITPPTATTGAASGITTSGATLNGTVNPNNAITTVSFDYGTNTTYNNNVTATTGGTLTGTTSSPATLTLNNLTCGTTYHFRVNASNSGGAVSGSDATFATSPCSADLSALVATSGTTPQSLTPTFLTTTKSYAAAVANSVTSITVTPTAVDPNATIKVNGTAVTSGSASTPITLTVGVNTISIVVTSRDSVATQTYTLAVTRAPADGSGTLTVNPASGTASATNQTVRFTYTAATGGISNGEIDISIAALGTLGSATTTSGTSAITGGVIKVTGVTLASGATATITWSGATFASTAGVKTLNTTQKSTATGTLTTLAASPTVTLGMFPTAIASGATGVGAVGAILNGTVNDNGTATTVTFDYGTTATYGTNVAATFNGTIAAGAGGTTGKAVSVTLTGLTCGGTIYHYRVKAVNATGTTYSTPDQSFTTSACPPAASTPTVSASADLATLTLQSDATGTGYFTLLAGNDAYCGSSIQTKAGQDGNASAAFRIGSLPLVAKTPATYTIRNLTANSPYTVCFTAADSSGTLATALASVNLTTTAASAYSNPVWSAVGPAGLPPMAYYPSLALAPDGTPYLGYEDSGNGTKATVMKYDGNTWVAVGSAGFSATSATFNYMAFAPDGTPYLAYTYGVVNATVMKYDGNTWVIVGSSVAGKITYKSLAFAPDGTPYMAYLVSKAVVGALTTYKATVVRYDGSAWVTVGSTGFSAANYVLSLAFSPDGTPYMAYSDAVNGNKTTVMKYDGNSWVTVGSAGFSAGPAAYSPLAFAPDGTPYVGSWGSGSKATVMKYDGTSWVTVGSAAFSAGAVSYTSLAFAPDGAPYLAYMDGANSNKATVMKYDGNTWVTVGSAAFSAGTVSYNTLAFAPDGTPYLSYQDGSKATVMKLTNGYTVTYDGNGATSGTVPTDSSSPYVAGATVTVPGNSGTLANTGYTFNGWNSAADGSGTAYAAAATITMGAANTTLYAQWAASPTVTGVSPASGTFTGGTTVTITGTNLTGATAVKFGAASATITANTANSITATSPAGTVGTVDITVTTPVGTSVTSSADQFTYFASPTVTGISPVSGPTAGGTSVTITGTYLTGATAVKFGATSASITSNTATQIVATSPAGSAGMVDITVVTAGGTSVTSSSDQFTYVAAPTVTGIAPASGPTAGSTSVTITGTNLSSATAVKFGTTTAKITSNSATQILVTSPLGAAGTVDITVTTAGGTSATSSSDQFTYIAAPAVTGISPASGPASGGTQVTITGTNLSSATSVSFGSNTAGITSNSATQIVATAPAGAVGTSHVTVTTAGGTSVATSGDQFTYVATYTVTYSGNSNTGGTAPTDSSSYVFGATVPVPGNTGTLTRTGYTFGGWNSAADGSGTNYTAGSGTFAINANTTLYAKWTALPTYTVTYNGNGNAGGNAPTDSSTYASGATVTVLGNTGSMVKTGYTFAGWNTAANGSGTAYAATATFAIAANTTLYAQWTASTTYSVTYSGNNNTGGNAPTDSSSPYTTGATVTVPGNTGTLTRTGYTFGGWNTAADGSGTNYTAGSGTFTINANTTLYAKWTAVTTYTVTYDGNGSTGGSVPIDSSSPYNPGTSVTVLGNSGSLVKTGNTFNGWNTFANGGGTAYAAAATFTINANTTLYAQWTSSSVQTVVANYSGNSLFTVDLVSGNRTTLSSSTVGTGVAFASPVGITREASGKILVGEGTGDILRVDATTGNRTVLSSSTVGTGPTMTLVYSLAVETNGNILAASYGQQVIYRIDPSSGNRTVVTSASVGSGVSMGSPFGLLVDTDGSIIFPSYSASQLIRVNASTGARTAISSATVGSGAALASPSSIVKMADGSFAVLNNGGTDYVLRVDPATGNRTIISSSSVGTGPSISSRYSMALDTSGNIYVADFSGNSIVKIDPATGNRTTVSNNSGSYGTGPSFISPLGMLSGAVASISSTTSAVATLSNLTLSSGILNPAFVSGTTSYTASVANSVSSITVTPMVTDSNATVKVNGTAVTSGSTSGSINLAIGSNTITVLVTAQDGTTTSSYTVTVTRAASAVSTLSNLTLSIGTLNPTFASGTASYSTSVANSVTSITATPTVSDSNATVKVNGTTVTSGTASTPINLNIGSNTITILVTAQDGTTTSSYTVTVTRAASTDATLTALSLSSGTLSPTFASDTTSYSTSVANSVTSITVTPTVRNSNATVKVNGTTVTSGTASGSIALALGNNTITVLVTAQDGITISSYTITVTRSKPGQTIGTISFAPATLTVGNSTMVSATATSNLTVQFASTTPTICTVSNNTVTAVAVGSCTITGDQPGNASYNEAPQVSNSITVTKASQTVSFPGMDNPIAKTYGAPDFSIAALATSNLPVTLTSSSNPAVATITSGGLIHITGAGTTTITATQAGNAGFNSANATISLTVAPAPLTIKADNKSRDYGAADPTFTVTYTGFVNSETSAVLGGTPVVATNATSTSPSGSYDITPSQGGITNANYSITYVKGTLAVGLSSQSIVFNPLPAKTYGDGTFTLSATGGASGNPVTFTSSDITVATIDGSTVTIVGAGTATITASQAGDNINYAPASAQQPLTVNKASLMVNADSYERFYGDANPTFTVSYSGFVNNETSAVLTGTPAITTTATTASPTGSYDITPAAGTLSSSNYKFTLNRGTLAVNLILQNITFTAIPAKTYGNAAFNPGATGGPSGYAITYTSSDSSVATVSGSTVVIVGAGQTLITANQAGDANYSTATAAQLLKVAPAPLTVTAADKNRAYGASDPTFTVTYNGFVNNEGQGVLTGTPTLATTATSTSNSGGYPITVAIGSLASNNYTFTYVNGTLTVAKNTATVTLDAVSLSTAYDGTAKAATATTVPAGLYVVMTYTDTGSNPVTSPTDAGTYSVSGAISDTGYSGSTSGTLTIAKANQTVSGLAATVTKTYGNADFSTGATATSGLAITYQSSNTGVATVSTSDVVHIVGAGTTTITATQTGNGNYNATSAQMALTVNKATLTVTATNASRLAGAANPTFSATYSGFVNGETVAVLTGAPSITTTATTASAAGSYPITPAVGTLGAANYTFSYVPGTLAVGMSTQTIIFNPLNAETYGALPFSLTAAGGASGNPVTFTSSNTTVATINGSIVTIVGAGSTTITANQAGNTSYAPASAQQTLTVKPATLLVSANNASRTYGNANPAFTVTYTGFVNNDTAAALTGTPAITTTATSSSQTGSYPITPAAGTLASNNYSFIFTPGTLGVNLASQNIIFNPLPARTYGDPAFDPGAIGDASGNLVSYTSSNPSVATASGSTVTIVGVGQTVITANQAGNSNYASATAAQILNVTPATLTVMAAGVTRPYNTSNPVLTVQYSGFAYADTATSLSGAPVLTTTAVTSSPSGSYPITITAGNLFSSNYNFTFDNGTLTVLQVTPTVTWSNPAAITYGNPLGATQLNATASVPGSFSYAPLSGAVLNAGLSQVLNVAFTPTDTNYGGTTGSAGIDVVKASQAIVFGASPTVVVNGSGAISATGGGSTSAVIFNSTTPLTCSISGTTVTGITAGTCTIVANQAGDANYTAASQVTKNITISQATATVTIGSLSQTYDGTPKYASATTTPSNLTVNITYNGSTTVPTVAGSYTVVATISATSYVGSATATLTIAKAPQTVSFTAATISKVYGNADFGPGATASAGGAVTYSSSDPTVASMTSAGLVHIVAAGTATITATQAGDANYLSAAATQMLTVNKATLTITAANASRAFGASDPPFSATYSGFVNGDSTSVITGTPAFTTTDTSSSPVGSYTITPSIGTLSAANYNFTFSPGTLAVGIASQSIIFNPLAPVTYGATPLTLTATGGLSGNSIIFTSSNPAVATVNGTTVTITGAGSATITATQAETSNYAQATAQQTLTVNPTPLMVTANNAQRFFGDPDPVFSVIYTGFVNGETAAVLTGTPAITTIATTTSPSGSYPITPAAGTLAAANYSFIFPPGTLAVNVVSQTITFNQIPAKTYGATAFNLTATGDASGYPVTFTSSNPGVATVSGSTVTITGAGQTIIIANQAGDFNYASATAQQLLTVNPATLTVTATSATRSYGQVNPTFSLTYGGFVNSEGQSVLLGAPVLATTAGTTSPVASYPITVASGNLFSNNYTFSYMNGTLAVGQSTPLITWATPTAITYSTALGSAQLNATANIPGGFSYTPTSGTLLNAGLGQALSTTFTPTDTVNYSGVTKGTTIDVAKAGQTITFGAAPTVLVNGTGTLSATGGGSTSAVVFTSTTTSVCTVSGTTVTGIVAGTCTIAANQAGDANYTAASQVTQTLTVGKRSQTITFGAAPSVVIARTGTVSATAASGLAVTFVSTTPTTCTISGTTVTGVAIGTCSISASQAGNATYLAAPSVSQNLTVAYNSAKPTLVVSALSDGATTTDVTQNISGTVSDVNGITSVTIRITPKGQPAGADITVQVNPDGSFSYPVQLLTGANTITVIVTNNAGTTTTDTRTIILDASAPKLTVTYPPDNGVSYQKPITVTGTIASLFTPAKATAKTVAADPTLVVSYSINGSTPQSASLTDTNYSFTTTLADGMNTIKVFAANGAGQKVEAKRTVSYELPTFSIAVTDPAADAHLALNSYVLSGAVTNNTTPVTVTISMDGQSYTPTVDTNGVFKQQLIFTEDKTYQISVTGVDQNNNSQMALRNIIHTVPKAADGTITTTPFTIVDALQALQMSVGILTPNNSQILRMDVAPMVNGVSMGDGKIDIEDVLIILYMAVGLIH